jgi:effector-binding domain-containing protein
LHGTLVSFRKRAHVILCIETRFRRVLEEMCRSLFTLFFVLVGPLLMAAPQAFAPTEVGVSELKTLPAGVLLKAQGQGNYFSESNQLFRPLFNYISTHNIAMTTPVEARIDDAAMYFWVAESERSKVAGSGAGVEVLEIPERRVASLGARGSYSASNFAKTRDALVSWISTQPGVETAGPAYGVYWNGPFTLGFMKRFEVHLPVRATAAK